MNTAAVGSEPSVKIASASRQITRRSWRPASIAVALLLFGGTSALAQNCTDLSNPLINNLGGTASAAAGAASALAGSLGNVSTAFVSQQTSAFVAGATSDRPDQQSGGVWARGVVGTVDTKSSTSAVIVETNSTLPGGATSVSGTCASKVSQDYWGVQAGTDIARLNMNGWNVHLGITAGYFESRGQDVAATAPSTLANPVIASLQDGFQVPFIGGYVVATQGSFFSDLTVRREIYNVSFTQPGLNLYNQHFGARAWSISGGAGYNFGLQDGWFVEPSAGLIWSRTSVDPFGLVGPTFAPQGESPFQLPGMVSINDINSLLGRATVRVGKNFTSDGVAWQPFASASVFHEFAGDVTTNFISCAGCVFRGGEPATITGTFSTSRVGTYGQLSAGLASQIINTGWVSFIRGDYRFGSNIEGWNATAGVRYNFVPEALPARGKMVVKAPVLAALYDWSGFYIGGHAGVTQGRGHIGFVDAATTVDPYISGYLWGGQVGYNLQYGPYLVGWEVEASRTKTSGTKLCGTSSGRDPVTGESTGVSPLFLSCANSLEWIATAAVRLGFVPWWSDRTLLYVKAGGAATSLAANINCIFGPANDASGASSGNFNFCRGVTGLPTNDFYGSDRRFGGLLAAGVEFGLTRNVSAKAEIAYIKFANGDITANDGTRLNIGAGIAEGKIGLNYRFNQPVAASY